MDPDAYYREVQRSLGNAWQLGPFRGRTRQGQRVRGQQQSGRSMLAQAGRYQGQADRQPTAASTAALEDRRRERATRAQARGMDNQLRVEATRGSDLASAGGGLDSLMAMLFGGGGGNDLSGLIGSSYDQQIGAFANMGSELERLTGHLIGNIHSSRDATNQQIGGFFNHAAGQANAGRPVIAETGQTAQANVDAIYDTLAGNLAAMPAQSVAQASAAAGEAVGGSVAGRVAAATAPFAAAGETSRANTKANLTQHSAAGQDYLSQLAAAAPSEAAMAQSAVSGRAANAVTEAEMALAQQRAQIAAQTAALEGAKQRALIEASADTAGSTFERLMQTTQLFNALGADTSPLLSSLGLQPDAGGGMDYGQQLDIMLKEQRLADMLAPRTSADRLSSELQSASPSVQQFGQQLLDLVDTYAARPNEKLSMAMDLLGRTTRDQNAPNTVDSLEELLADPEAMFWSPIDAGQLRAPLRRAFQ